MHSKFSVLYYCSHFLPPTRALGNHALLSREFTGEFTGSGVQSPHTDTRIRWCLSLYVPFAWTQPRPWVRQIRSLSPSTETQTLVSMILWYTHLGLLWNPSSLRTTLIELNPILRFIKSHNFFLSFRDFYFFRLFFVLDFDWIALLLDFFGWFDCLLFPFCSFGTSLCMFNCRGSDWYILVCWTLNFDLF